MIRFEEATISPSDPFALWPQYLEHLVVINRAVRRHNTKVWKRHRLEKRREDRVTEIYNREINREYKIGTVDVLKPTVEDYLTWRMKQGQS